MSESNWAGKTLPQMWASAQAADTQTAWQQVNAWRRTHDLLLHHAGRLKAYADELAYAWPPGRSPAAQAFIAYITQLNEAILKASTDAATNYTAIAGVLTSLSAAKADMAKLKQAWDEYEGAPTAEMAYSGSEAQEALNMKARARMAQNDQEVLESSRRFVELTAGWREEVWKPVPMGSESPGGANSRSAQGAPAARDLQSSWITAPSVSPANLIDGEIGLAGSPVASSPAGVADAPTHGAISGTFPASGSQISQPSIGAVGRMPGMRAPSIGVPGSAGGPVGFRAAPVGAASGGPSASPLAVGTGRGQGKTNPVGGVIEPTRPASSAMPLPFGGGGRGSAEDHRGVTAPPTMFWDVQEGVSPVIEPTPELPFELGPGVIGIDR